MENNQNIDEIPIIERASGFDLSNYESKRVKIAKVSQVECVDYYPDGETFNKDSKEKTMKLEIETEPLKVLDNDGNFTTKDLEISTMEGQKKVTVTARLPLQNQLDTDGKKQWVITKHAKSKAWAFLRKMSCTKPSELIGKFVTLTLEPSKTPGDNRKFLRIVM